MSTAELPGADHQHALAFELLLRLDVMGMQHLAVEMAGIGRDDRLPVMSIGDDQPGIEPRRALALDLHAPALRRVCRAGALRLLKLING